MTGVLIKKEELGHRDGFPESTSCKHEDRHTRGLDRLYSQSSDRTNPMHTLVSDVQPLGVCGDISTFEPLALGNNRPRKPTQVSPAQGPRAVTNCTFESDTVW